MERPGLPAVEDRPPDMGALIAWGWRAAAASLAAAATEQTLVTHWFLTPEDASVNSDDHFGSNARTLRFLGVVLPTLIDQLAASMAMVAVPWDVEFERPTLTVVGLRPGEPAEVQSRPLLRLPDGAGDGPPWWALGEQHVPAPAEIAGVAAGLRI